MCKRLIIPMLLLGGALPAQEEGTQAVPPAEQGTALEQEEVISPQKTVERLHEALLRAMRQGEQLGYEGRYELLEPVVRNAFDFKVIARFSVGPFWEKLSEEQRKRLQEKLLQYAVASYAAEFKSYGGERFEIVESQPFRRRFRAVRALLKSPDETVEFLYLLRKVGDGWKIFDVRADGVSDLALKRAQFTQLLERDGFEALIAKLDEKITAYAEGKEKPELRKPEKGPESKEAVREPPAQERGQP